MEESARLDHLYDVDFPVHLGDSFLDRSLLPRHLATLEPIG